jgi:predicted Zn-dependent peptidase
MGDRFDESYYVAELMSDILSRGNSSRLYRNLVKEKQVFSEVHAYMTGSLDKGIFAFEGKPLENISIETAEAALWEEIERLKTEEVAADELTKVQNKTESTMIFSEMALLDKAMNLASFELLGDAGLLNHETEKYLEVSPAQIKALANKMFRKDNSSTLIYLAEKV